MHLEGLKELTLHLPCLQVYNGEGEYRTTLYAVKNEPLKLYGIVQMTQ